MAINQRTKAQAEDQTELVGFVGTAWFSLIILLILVSFAFGRIRSAMAKRYYQQTPNNHVNVLKPFCCCCKNKCS